ncbi:uncharacterized protein LOC128229911 [Mya arenaria]|uniref:uncharacterized protein LOC128229911 n=1 Tax=Mya arenaria TaxID=6604 RepID=UPI0022E8E02B|nr:uncharacterized protein LOC128229911 [Mya arenaria]
MKQVTMILQLILLVTGVFYVSCVNTACHGPSCCHGIVHQDCLTGGVSTSEVNSAMVNLNLHYNLDLCLEILLIKCANHVTKGDEVICASNNVTYENHCHFAHAKCEFHVLHQRDLQVIHAGQCFASTTAPTVRTSAPSTPDSTTTGLGVTPEPTTDKHTASISPSTTTSPDGTTSDPINSIIASVFCQHVASIDCSGSYQIICGTDGQFYPNTCALSKEKCNQPYLTVAADATGCVP